MIEEERGRIDYEECGAGPTIVMVPGSCSTGAAWRPVIAALGDDFRCVTTSLLGYGGTAERRTTGDASIVYEAEVLESVIRRAGGRVHLVGHSLGGLVSLAVVLRNKVSVASLVIAETPATELLRDANEDAHYQAFRRMTEAYFAAVNGGDKEAIASMIDFYGGAGTYASWPPRVRAHAVETTHVNIVDWASVYGFSLSAELLAAIDIPVLIVRGGASHPAVQRANELLSECIDGAALATIKDASHFVISTHPGLVSRLIAEHARSAEAEWRPPLHRWSAGKNATSGFSSRFLSRVA